MQATDFRVLVDAYKSALMANAVARFLQHPKVQSVSPITLEEARKIAEKELLAGQAAKSIAQSSRPAPSQTSAAEPPPNSTTTETSDPGSIVPSPAGAVVQNVSPPESTAAESVRAISPLDRVGLAIAEAYRKHGLDVHYEPPACSRGLRCNRFTFRKALGVLFSKLEKCEEVLSHAGFDPHLPVTFRPLPNDRFEIHIPRPPEQWKSCNLFDYLTGFKEASQHLSSGRPAKFFQTLRQSFGVKPGDDLKARLAIDLDGLPIDLNLNVGAIFVGAPNMGKSTGIETIGEGLCLAYPPEWLNIYIISYKNGSALTHLEVFPHVKRILTNHNSSPEELLLLFEELRTDQERYGKTITGAGYSKIQEYNEQHPDAPIPWTVILDDEAALTKKAINSLKKNESLQDIVERWMQNNLNTLADCVFDEILSFWRASGGIYIGGTQYPRGDRAWDKSVRMCFGSSAIYQCSPDAAKMALEAENARTRYWINMAPNLYPGGDCIINDNGTFYRGQTLRIPPADKKNLMYFASQAWGKQSPQASERSLLPTVKQQPTRSENQAAWERVHQVLQREGNQISINKMLEAAYGAKGPKSSGYYKPKLVELLRSVGQNEWANWVERGGQNANAS